MTSVLISVLAALRGLVRSRAAIHFEVLALRHQPLMLQRSRPRRLRIVKSTVGSGRGCRVLDRLASGGRYRQTGNRHRLKSARLPVIFGHGRAANAPGGPPTFAFSYRGTGFTLIVARGWRTAGHAAALRP